MPDTISAECCCDLRTIVARHSLKNAMDNCPVNCGVFRCCGSGNHCAVYPVFEGLHYSCRQDGTCENKSNDVKLEGDEIRLVPFV